MLIAILVACGILYTGSLIGIVLFYVYFGGCSTNEAFIFITLAMSLICTVVQLTKSDNGSLLTSATITAYATYLCGTAISKNPIAECNPKLGETSTGNIILGLLLMTLSLLWTGWSSAADKRVGETPDVEEAEAQEEGGGEKPKVGGVVLNDTYGAADSPPAESATSDIHDLTTLNAPSFSNLWKLNVILALVCCWYAMALTSWGVVEMLGEIANPDVGSVSVWMLIVSQWIVWILYLWTLVAPMLFPHRDFS